MPPKLRLNLLNNKDALHQNGLKMQMEIFALKLELSTPLIIWTSNLSAWLLQHQLLKTVMPQLMIRDAQMDNNVELQDQSLRNAYQQPTAVNPSMVSSKSAVPLPSLPLS